MKMPNIKLQSLDDVIFEVDAEIAKCSVTIKNALERLDVNEDGEKIVLLDVQSAILRKVIQWATYHKDDSPPLPKDCENKEKSTDDISSWDVSQMDTKTLFDLLVASTCLDIKELSDVTCKALAERLPNKQKVDAEKEKMHMEYEECEEK